MKKTDMKLLNTISMKTIFTLLTLFCTYSLFAQDLTLELSNYPSGLDKVMNQYKTITPDDKEKWHFDLDGNERRTRSDYGSGGFYGKYTSTSDPIFALFAKYKDPYRSKGQIEITDIKRDDAKYGGFKVSTNGNNWDTGMTFSTDGQYVIAVGLNKGQLYYYAYEIETKKLVIKAQKIEMDKQPQEISAIGGSGINDLVCVTSGTNDIIIINTKTFTGITYSSTAPVGYSGYDCYKYIYPSTISNHFLLSTRYISVLFDASEGKEVYSDSVANKSSNSKGFFVQNGQTSTRREIDGKPLSGPGIGVIGTENSVIVFDTDMNYFTLSNNEKVDVLDYVKVKGENTNLDPQPDPIPIISDVLNPEKVVELFERVTEVCQNNNNRKLAFQVFESAEPFSEELIKLLSESDNTYVIEYIGKDVASWINNTPKLTLSKDGKEVNVKRNTFLQNYLVLSEELSQDEFGRYLADQTEIENALEKMKPLTADLFYMSIDELVQKGNKAIVAGAKLSPKAALLGLRFFEVAADKEPSEPIHQANIGNAYLLANDYDRAVESYNKALAIRPDYPLALFGIMKATFVPIERGEKTYNDNLAKSIVGNADRFLAIAPADYLPEMKYAKRAKAFSELYLADQGLYAAYNLATSMSNIEMRTKAVVELMPKIAATGNSFLVADMANISGFDYIKIAESKRNDVSAYKKADDMLRKSVKGGVYDPETYYEWARININFLNNKSEGIRIVNEAQKKYPGDKNFGSLLANDYYNAGRDNFLKKSYSNAIPQFEKYITNAKNIVPKAYDYLGFSYYYTKNYPKAAANLQLLKDNDDPNTLQAYYANFNAVLAYAKNPSGTAPVLKDNSDKILAMEDSYIKGQDMVGAGQKTEGLELMEATASYYDQINYDYGQSISHSGLGVTYHQMENTYKAKPHYEACIDAGAQSSACYNNLAIILINNDEISKAKSIVNDGLEKYPNASDLAKTKQYLYQ